MARILAVNAGSSSVKLSLIGDDDETLASQQLDVAGPTVAPDQLRQALSTRLGSADAVVHRIVHGGDRFSEPVRIDAGVEASLREIGELAPLHQPKSLAALDAVSGVLPDVPAIGCFDTAFHATLPAAARTYALPAAWRERWPLHRFGFHGLSHAWVARRTPGLLRV
jgi:acetate kinase